MRLRKIGFLGGRGVTPAPRSRDSPASLPRGRVVSVVEAGLFVRIAKTIVHGICLRSWAIPFMPFTVKNNIDYIERRCTNLLIIAKDLIRGLETLVLYKCTFRTRESFLTFLGNINFTHATLVILCVTLSASTYIA
jgi:hypothetical protein